MPQVSIETGAAAQVFTGALISPRKYRVAIASSALAARNIVTVNSMTRISHGSDCWPSGTVEVPVSYRKVVMCDGLTTISDHRGAGAPLRPRFNGTRLTVPPGTTWRIVDVCGRLVAAIGPECNVWIPSPRLALKLVILLPAEGSGASQKPMQIVIGK